MRLQDLEQLRKQTRNDLHYEIEVLRSEMSHQFDDLKEAMRDGQTELLKAFYNYTQTTDIKVKDFESADFNLRQRLSIIESRVTELERRINTPPPSN